MSLDNDDLNIKEWANCYLNKTVKLVSPHVDRLASNAEKNNPLHFFKFYLDSIEIDLKQTEKQFPETLENIGLKIHATLLDLKYKQFFGRTWIGPLKRLENKSCDYDENVFFSSSLVDSNILVVIEVVAQLEDDYYSLGWSAFRPFDEQSSNESLKKMSIFNGTPRALLFMDDQFEKNEFLKKISGACVNYSFVSRPKLSQFKLFIPENILLGANDRIGGITRGIKKRIDLYSSELDFFGHRFSAYGLSIQENKLDALLKAAQPSKHVVS